MTGLEWMLYGLMTGVALSLIGLGWTLWRGEERVDVEPPPDAGSSTRANLGKHWAERK